MSTDSITRQVRIAASPQRVWDVVTRAEHVGRWFADAGVELDLRPGGAMRLTWAGEAGVLGRVEQVSPIDLFSFRWASRPDTEPGPGNSTLVEFRLFPDGDGTLLVVTETGFDALDVPLDARERHRRGNQEGWARELAELVAYAEQAG